MVDRANIANQIAQEQCLTFRGEKVCDPAFTKVVSDLVAEGLPHDQWEVAAKNGQDAANAIISKNQKLGNQVTLASTGDSTSDEGCCAMANPLVPWDVAPIVMVLDIFLPGIGTIVSAYYGTDGCNCRTITCGVFQAILTPILVGWIWSVVQGCQIYNKSKDYYSSSS